MADEYEESAIALRECLVSAGADDAEIARTLRPLHRRLAAMRQREGQ